MPTPKEGGSSWRWFRCLLVALVICRGLVELCVLPPFEGWDEYQHVGYVVHILETGRPAVLGATNVPRSLLATALALPHSDAALRQIGPLGAIGYADYWKDRPPPTLRPGWIPL